MTNPVFPLLLIGLAANPMPTIAEGCKPLQLLSESGPKYFKSIVSRGEYCLDQNIFQKDFPRRYDYRSGLVGREHFIAIESSEVKLNLKSKQLTSFVLGWSGIKDGSSFHSKRAPVVRVMIHNGKIDVQRDGIGAVLPRRQPIASTWSDLEFEPLQVRPFEEPGEPSEVPEPYRRQLEYTRNYTGSSYHFENLTILAGAYALKLAGRGNIIRGNRIEVSDSKSAIYLFGPDNIIENNIIIFRGDAVTMTAAPIKLHLGDRTIIRNNLIIIETDEKAPRHVVSLIESADVQFTGNRVYGVSKLARAFDEISSIESSENQIQPLDKRPTLSDDARKASEVR